MATVSSQKPLMLGKIPSVDIIKELLGLNAAPVKVKNAFRDITVEWRKTNMTSNCQPATDLVDWHSPAVQKDLYTLAENFLADEDNAERFWSASRPWKYDSKLQYPDDKERIIELLVQLFFKQNRYFKNNATYGPWNHKDPESQSSREGSTPQRMASIDPISGKDTKKSSRKRPRSETAETLLSPSSNFIDLSGSFGGSPTLPWDHALPTSSKDIYDMPDEQEPAISRRSFSHSSSLPSKHIEAEQMADTSPSKRRGKYYFRARTNPPFSAAIYDAALDKAFKEMEGEDNSLVQSYPQSLQRAPVAPMMSNMDFGSSEHQPARQVGSADSSQNHSETMTKGKPGSGSGSSQMPPPPRASKKTPSPQNKPPKSYKVILKTTKGSYPSLGTSESAHTTSGLTTGSISATADSVSRPKISSTSPSSHQSSEAGSLSKMRQRTNVPIEMANDTRQPASSFHNWNSKTNDLPKDVHQSDVPVGATASSKQSTPSASQPSPRLSNFQKASVNSPSAEDATSGGSPQTFAPKHAETDNNRPATKPGTTPLATAHAEPRQNSKPKASSPENPSKQRPKAAQIKFFIVTREPRDTRTFWPEGKIQGTSLSDFIADVAKATQRDCIEKLDLTLKTSTSDTKVPVAKDDEDSWLLAKKEFMERLKAARVKAKSKGLDETSNPEIEVEPFYGQVGNVEDVEEENADEDEEICF